MKLIADLRNTEAKAGEKAETNLQLELKFQQSHINN